MARPECDILDRLDGKTATPCDDGCKNYHFPHLDNACVLSEVYSVRKGEPCLIYEPRKD